MKRVEVRPTLTTAFVNAAVVQRTKRAVWGQVFHGTQEAARFGRLLVTIGSAVVYRRCPLV